MGDVLENPQPALPFLGLSGGGRHRHAGLGQQAFVGLAQLPLQAVVEEQVFPLVGVRQALGVAGDALHQVAQSHARRGVVLLQAPQLAEGRVGIDHPPLGGDEQQTQAHGGQQGVQAGLFGGKGGGQLALFPFRGQQLPHPGGQGAAHLVEGPGQGADVVVGTVGQGLEGGAPGQAAAGLGQAVQVAGQPETDGGQHQGR